MKRGRHNGRVFDQPTFNIIHKQNISSKYKNNATLYSPCMTKRQQEQAMEQVQVSTAKLDQPLRCQEKNYA